MLIGIIIIKDFMPTRPQKRMTSQRRIILEELLKSGMHPTADELFLTVRERIPRISLGTVYRNLRSLAEDGRVRPLSDGSRMRFDGNLREHYHIRCLNCGTLDDLPAAAVKGLNESPERWSSYRIIGYKIEFVGFCPNCINASPEVSIEEEMLSDFKRCR